jgi:MFS family permease
VAPAAQSRRSSAGRAFCGGDKDRLAARPVQPSSARNAGASGGVLPVCQLLLGAAAAGREDPDSGGPEIYGILLGAIGVGAVGGAFFTHAATARLGVDRLVAVGTAGTAVALLLYAVAWEPWLAIAASLIAGVAWISVLASLNVSAQVALPNWVRGRGLAIYVAVMFGGMAVGSLLWGEMANLIGLPGALAASAACCLIGIPATRQWKLQTGKEFDFMPSMHWPAPITALDVKADRGPVLVTVEYRVPAGARTRFIRGIRKLGRERGRDGAYAWGVYEDVALPGRFLETFLLESWIEHLRQHQRVTNADRLLEAKVNDLLEGSPVVTHLIAPNERAGS